MSRYGKCVKISRRTVLRSLYKKAASLEHLEPYPGNFIFVFASVGWGVLEL